MQTVGRWRLILALAGVLLATHTLAAPRPLVLYNAVVHTVDKEQPRAEAVVAVDGRISFVGSTDEALRRAPADAERIDLHGQAVFPGFSDAHAHLAGIGFRELEFNLEGVESLAELQERLAERARQIAPGEWLTGRGWIESRWSPPVFPTRQDLDAVVSDRPVVLTRADGHSLVANTLALKRAGIERDTAAPAGGQILRDENGEPNGMLIDAAMTLVTSLIPEPTEERVSQALEAGAERYTRFGWTQLQNAGSSQSELELLCRLYEQGRVKLRVYGAVDGPGPDAQWLLKRGQSGRSCDDRLAIRSIKLYIDGALGSRGAALLKPYSDAPKSTGLLINDPDALFPLLTEALRRGIQIQTHAIGDRGNRIVLDLYERAFSAVPRTERPVTEPRWRIEHAQILDPADIARFGKLGVIASMQPSHAITDLFFAPQRLGRERLAGAYVWKSLLDTGAVVAAGSDAPVEQGDPRVEFYAAVVRQSLDGFSDENWHRQQRVSRKQALEMLTLAPAYAAFQEHERGSVTKGKQADLTVLSGDLLTVPETEILKTRVVLTVIGGEVVYRESEDHVDGGDRRETGARVTTGNAEHGADDHADAAVPVVFDRRRQREHFG